MPGAARVRRQGRVQAISTQLAAGCQGLALTGPASSAPSSLALGKAGFRITHCSVSPRLGHWLCCFMATRPVSRIRACLGWAFPSWGLWLLNCPCRRVLTSLRGPGDVRIFAVTLNEQALLPPELPPCSPCWLWRGPFPAGGTCQLRVHDSKWRH